MIKWRTDSFGSGLLSCSTRHPQPTVLSSLVSVAFPALESSARPRRRQNADSSYGRFCLYASGLQHGVCTTACRTITLARSALKPLKPRRTCFCPASIAESSGSSCYGGWACSAFCRLPTPRTLWTGGYPRVSACSSASASISTP
jgi:hypothetical protein